MSDMLQHFSDRTDTYQPKRARPRPKVISSEFSPTSDRPLGDYKKTPLVTGEHSPQTPEELLRASDADLVKSIPRGTKDTLANLRIQMDNRAQQLLLDPPMHVQPEWLLEPMKFRNYILASLPNKARATPETTAWLEQFARLVALDIRAQRLGNIQILPGQLWNEMLRHNEEEKRGDLEGQFAHTKKINARAEELYSEWKSLPREDRPVLERENDKVRAHQKFVLLRAQETCRMKTYRSSSEVRADMVILEKLSDSILIKDRFAQLIETSLETPTRVEVTFDDDEPTVIRQKPAKPPVPPKPGFFRRMTAPFVAAASLLVGLGGAQQTAERTVAMDWHPDTTEQTPEPAPLPVATRSETKASDGQATVRANEESPSESTSRKRATHTVEKGDRLWDVARQEIADERGVDLKRVARDDREILPRVQALKILNDIDDATKLEVGTELQLQETQAVSDETLDVRDNKNTKSPDAHVSPLTSHSPSDSHVSPLTAHSSPEVPREVIKSRGDTAWAHADSMLESAGVKSTTLRRRLVAALMLKDSGNLNAYKLKIGQELTTTRANAAIEQLKAGKNPADIARSMGIEWPVRGL